MPRKSRNQIKWEQLAPECIENGVSDWKTVDQIKAAGLNWSKNGNQRHGKFFGLTKYNWESEKLKTKVIRIRTTGFDENVLAAKLLKNRPISERIRAHFRNVPCVACGSTKSLVVDHKNDLYNEPRVMCAETQQISDFQSLCNACNLKKRADCSKTKKDRKRQPAPHGFIQMGGLEFIEGDETFDDSPEGLGLKGTYWYDVEKYYSVCRSRRE